MAELVWAAQRQTVEGDSLRATYGWLLGHSPQPERLCPVPGSAATPDSIPSAIPWAPRSQGLFDVWPQAQQSAAAACDGAGTGLHMGACCWRHRPHLGPWVWGQVSMHLTFTSVSPASEVCGRYAPSPHCTPQTQPHTRALRHRTAVACSWMARPFPPNHPRVWCCGHLPGRWAGRAGSARTEGVPNRGTGEGPWPTVGTLSRPGEHILLPSTPGPLEN